MLTRTSKVLLLFFFKGRVRVFFQFFFLFFPPPLTSDVSEGSKVRKVVLSLFLLTLRVARLRFCL